MSRWIWMLVALVTVVLVAVVVAVLKPGGPTTPIEAMAPPHFSEDTLNAGVDHAYDGGWTYFAGGGVAVLDCDGNAFPDMYVAGGENPAALLRNESGVGGSVRFDEISSTATELTGVTGAYPLDIDSDGLMDLVVLRLGENVLLRGIGDCRFERANEAWRFDGGDEWTTAFSAKWEGDNQFPTLAMGNYVELDDQGSQTGECSDNVIVRPDGQRFGEAVALAPSWCTLSVLFSDWDRTGRGDLRVANDRHYYRDGEEQLWRIAEGEDPDLYTREQGWQQLQIWGMGIASHDVTGDGLPEVFLTSMGDNKLQTLTDGSNQPNYDDIALGRGVLAHRPHAGGDVMPSTAWHPEFQDVNNDGFMDLYVSKGNVDAMPDSATSDPNNLLIGQPDGTFVESAGEAGIVHFARTRGGALADLNLDGMLDLVEVNRVDNVKVWENVGWGETGDSQAMGNWVAVRLDQPRVNVDGVGSWIEVKIGDHTMSREVTVGGGHAGGQLGWTHFGLGPSSEAEIRVVWPDGKVGRWMSAEANQFVTITRGESEPIAWLPED